MFTIWVDQVPLEEESDSARETRKFTPGGEDVKDFFLSRIMMIFLSMIVTFLSRIMVMIMLMTSMGGSKAIQSESQRWDERGSQTVPSTNVRPRTLSEAPIAQFCSEFRSVTCQRWMGTIWWCVKIKLWTPGCSRGGWIHGGGGLLFEGGKLILGGPIWWQLTHHGLQYHLQDVQVQHVELKELAPNVQTPGQVGQMREKSKCMDQ